VEAFKNKHILLRHFHANKLREIPQCLTYESCAKSSNNIACTARIRRYEKHADLAPKTCTFVIESAPTLRRTVAAKVVFFLSQQKVLSVSQCHEL
jgi:hypothetical protein